MSTPLTEAVLYYQKTGEGFDKCLRLAGEIVYTFPCRKYNWDIETCSDFYCFFYPRLKRILKKFRYIEKPFESLLYTYLRYHVKTFYAKKKQNEMKYSLVKSCFSINEPYYKQHYAFEDEIELSAAGKTVLHINEQGKIGKESAKKRFIYLLLKNYLRISENMKDCSCRLLDINTDEMEALMNTLDERIRERRKRFSFLQEKRNRYLSQLFEYEQKDDKTAVKLMKKRLDRTIRELSRVCIDPTHKEIGELLGVPKGTIDTGIHYLKNSLNKHREKICS